MYLNDTGLLYSRNGIYTIANGQNHIKIIKINKSVHRPIAFLTNYSNFLSSCFYLQLPNLVNLFDMVSYSILLYSISVVEFHNINMYLYK